LGLTALFAQLLLKPGDPKSPTLSVYYMVNGEYEVRQFRDDERVESLAFPELQLTAKQIFNN
jgi:Uma2 family endonuclease